MNWFYVLNGYRAGPVSDAELVELVLYGKISSAAPIWREGMPDWRSYAQVAITEPTLTPQVNCQQCKVAIPIDQGVVLGSTVVCPQCRPIALEMLRENTPINGDFVPLRKKLFQHEASLRFAGMFYSALGGAGLVLGSAVTIQYYRESLPFALERILSLPVVIGIAVIAGFLFYTGLALRKLRPSASLPARVVAGMLMLALPLGTFIGGYVLILLLSRRGRFILSPDYHAVLAGTPSVRARVSAGTWIILSGLLLLVLWLLTWIFAD